jgi:LPXTG-site transpeptidase (sortase) family protein
MTKQHLRTFFIRFLGYFCIIAGLFASIFQFGPVLGVEANYRFDQIFNIHHSLSSTNSNGKSHSFSQISAKGGGSDIKPISTDFGIVIEKIDANAVVVPNIDPGNATEYMDALTKGVAATNTSTPPGQPGNLYIFSHSTDAPWNVARYNAIFYLLRELNTGDRVVIFYKGVRYDYIVFDKTIVSPKDISFLTNRYDKPVLTLQTCDPPGTSINRLIVRAQLVGS